MEDLDDPIFEEVGFSMRMPSALHLRHLPRRSHVESWPCARALLVDAPHDTIDDALWTATLPQIRAAAISCVRTQEDAWIAPVLPSLQDALELVPAAKAALAFLSRPLHEFSEQERTRVLAAWISNVVVTRKDASARLVGAWWRLLEEAKWDWLLSSQCAEINDLWGQLGRKLYCCKACQGKLKEGEEVEVHGTQDMVRSLSIPARTEAGADSERRLGTLFQIMETLAEEAQPTLPAVRVVAAGDEVSRYSGVVRKAPLSCKKEAMEQQPFSNRPRSRS